jgi:hypothetical protein
MSLNRQDIRPLIIDQPEHETAWLASRATRPTIRIRTLAPGHENAGSRQDRYSDLRATTGLRRVALRAGM